MKNLLIILFALLSFGVFAQSGAPYVYTIDVSTITTDTTIFYGFRTEKGSSVTFDFTNFDADDATLSFGYSTNDSTMTAIDDTRNPFTLNTSTYTETVNGITKSRIAFRADKWNFKYVCWKLTLVSVTTGDLRVAYTR